MFRLSSGKPAPAQAFATMIEGMDKSLGDVLDHLDAQGVAENTLVFFLGDNGSDAPLGHQHEVACAAPLRGKKGAPVKLIIGRKSWPDKRCSASPTTICRRYAAFGPERTLRCGSVSGSTATRS